jgi:ribosomal protein L22
MADEETPEKPKRRARRKKAEDESAPEARRAPETEGEATPSGASASDADASSEAGADVDEVAPTPADEEAAEEAADVVLEAEAEAEVDEDTEAAAEAEAAKPKRAPRRRRAAKPKAGAAEAEATEAKAGDADAEATEADAGEAEPTPQKPARPAPTRRRARRDPNAPPPVVRAHAKYVRSSARKARLVCDHIRGKSVDEARAILAHTPRAVARDWSKLLESAIANAENNHELVGEDLYVKVAQADEGPTLKRYRPRAMGRATRIRKRTSHLTILLTPKE